MSKKNILSKEKIDNNTVPMSDRTHYGMHRGVQRLRELFGLVNSDCARCSSERERRAARVPSVVVDQPVVSSNSGFTASGWTSYKFHRPLPPDPGRNLSFFQYSTLASLGDNVNLVTRQFNAYCTEQGVMCTVTMDPTDYRQLFHFKNVSDRLVRIEHQGESRLLEPGEHVMLATKTWYGLEQASLPRITPLNGAWMLNNQISTNWLWCEFCKTWYTFSGTIHICTIPAQEKQPDTLVRIAAALERIAESLGKKRKNESLWD